MQAFRYRFGMLPAALAGILAVALFVSATPVFAAARAGDGPIMTAPVSAAGRVAGADYVLVSPPLTAEFKFTPSTLNLKSKGLWVDGKITVPAPCTASTIDVSSIRLNGVVPVDPAAPVTISGTYTLHVKFNRAAVELILPNGNNVQVTVTGTCSGDPFEGSDYIRVIHALVPAPVAGSHLIPGSISQVQWGTPSGVNVQSVALLSSYDGGTTWGLIAMNQPNNGHYNWTVPNVNSQEASVAVVLVESADATGYIVDGVLGVSGEFAIDGTTGVGPQGADFAIRGATPNPAQSELSITFSLKNTMPATLAMYDIAGRQVESHRVDMLGPGWHSMTLGRGASLSPGVYMIRLTQDGKSLTSRVSVVR